MKWSSWEATGGVGRHWETVGDIGRQWETAGDTDSGCHVGKGWSSRESPGAQHQESLGVVEVVVVYSPTNHLRMEIEPAAESPQPRLERGWVMPKSEKRMTDYMGLETRSTE